MFRNLLLLLVSAWALSLLPGCATNSCERREGFLSRLFNRNRTEVECCEMAPLCCEGPCLGDPGPLIAAPPVNGATLVPQSPMPNLAPAPRLVPQPQSQPQPYTPSSASR